MRNLFKSKTALRIMFFTYLAAVALFITSCQDNQNTQPAIGADCINNPSLCQTNAYQYNQGFTNYNFGSSPFYNNGYYGSGAGPFYYLQNSAYLCNCPAGSVPTYNNYAGLGCVQNNLLGGVSGYAYFGWGVNNRQWVNIPQISNLQGYSNNGCYNGVVQSCIVNDASSCGTGYACRATSAASAIGLCVSNGANGQTPIFR